MAFTSTDLANIEQALASGKRKVRIGLREIEYQSIDAMLKLRDEIKAELGKAAGVTRRPTAFYARTSKGL